MKEVPKSSCAAHGEKVRATKMNQRMVILQEWPLRKECKQNIERNENENLYKGVEECCSFLKSPLQRNEEFAKPETGPPLQLN